MTRTGKIARLPNQIRAELNQRLQDGQDGPRLLDWLNALPEVQETLEESFDGAPITKQNLSEWRAGGFPAWQIRQELIDHACTLYDADQELNDDVDASLLAGKMAAFLATRYAALLNTWDGEPDEKFEQKLRLLRGLNRDIALLQKTLSQSNRQEREQEDARNEQDRRENELDKDRMLAPLLAKMEANTMAPVYGEGEQGKMIAELLTRMKYNLGPPKGWEERLQRYKEAREAKAAQQDRKKSKPVAPSRTKSNQPEEAEAGPQTMPGDTENQGEEESMD
jgi:hypothetical protein